MTRHAVKRKLGGKRLVRVGDSTCAGRVCFESSRSDTDKVPITIRTCRGRDETRHAVDLGDVDRVGKRLKKGLLVGGAGVEVDPGGSHGREKG